MCVEVSRRLVWRAALLLTGLLVLAARPVLAQDATQAGLVIVSGSGAPATFCVDLAPDEAISGNELLQRAGVTVVAEQNAMGASICSLNGTGCAFPAQSCFCQCEGSPCTYWSYWRQDQAGAWQYATAGAANTRIRAGTVEGWVWGEGTTDTAKSPPAVTLGDICKAPAAETVAVPEAGTAALAQVEPQSEVFTGASVAVVVETQPAQSGSAWALAGLAALVVIPVAALLLLRRRKDDA